MNGNLAINIDEEALFEVLATANFAAPPEKATVRTSAGIIESTSEATSILPRFPDPGNRSPSLGTPRFPFSNAGTSLRTKDGRL